MTGPERVAVSRTRLLALKNFAYCVDCGHKVASGPARMRDILEGRAVGVCGECRGEARNRRPDEI